MAIYYPAKNDDQDQYLGGGTTDTDPFLNFFSYFLLLSTLIPISLIVTLEIVKIMQCYFIAQDANMYSVENDKGAKVSSTTINEELGQVSYIFSDKTGTLTQNIMEFKALSVGEQIYGDIGDTIQRKPSMIELKKEVEENFKSKKLQRLLENPEVKNDEPRIITSNNGKSKIVFKSDKAEVQEIIKLLSL